MSHGSALGSGGEFDRIRAIAAALGDDLGPIGDDTAPIPSGTGTLVVSTDASVEAVHFRRAWLAPEEIGWRAAMSALSDLAAAAAVPAGLTVALTVPQGSDDALVVELMRGVGLAARTTGCRVLGGDLTSGSAIALAITVFGRAMQPMSRRGTRPGDGVWVTGLQGGARAALLAWLDGREPPHAARVAFAKPRARIEAGQWLAAQGATAMLDLSDGLGGDLQHLAAASGVGLDVDLGLLPIHPSVHAEAARRGEPAPVTAATGGEDYELLVTLPPEFRAERECEPACGSLLTRIGTVTEGSGVTMRLRGERVEVGSFRHT